MDELSKLAVSLTGKPGWCSDSEWHLRTELAATYRVFHALGWSELIFNHITVRVPGPDKHFLINPFGLSYDEVRASNLVKVDLEGNIIGNDEFPINPAGYVVHRAIHAALDDAHCVMHTHTTAGLAVASMEGGVQPTNFYAAQLHDMIAYHDFEGITIHDDEGPRLLQALGSKRLLVLRNHGLLAHGVSIPHAFSLLWTLNRACEIQVTTDSMRGNAIRIPDDVCIKSTRDALQFRPGHEAGAGILAALIRKAERIDNSYAT